MYWYRLQRRWNYKKMCYNEKITATSNIKWSSQVTTKAVCNKNKNNKYNVTQINYSFVAANASPCLPLLSWLTKDLPASLVLYTFTISTLPINLLSIYLHLYFRTLCFLYHHLSFSWILSSCLTSSNSLHPPWTRVLRQMKSVRYTLTVSYREDPTVPVSVHVPSLLQLHCIYSKNSAVLCQMLLLIAYICANLFSVTMFSFHDSLESKREFADVRGR
jgi:hypothetical protein